MSREEILADFQACTGIEDLGLAIMHLEETNWVLVDAVNRAIPQDGGGGVDPVAGYAGPPDPVVVGSLPSSSPPLLQEQLQPIPPPSPPQHSAGQESMNQVDMGGRMALGAMMGMMGSSRGGQALPGVSIASDFLPMGNSTRSRLLELNIEYRDRMIHLKVPDHESISTVKTLLQEKVGVPPCQQELRGWKGNAVFPLTDRRLLQELNLPKENFLYLLTPEIPAQMTNGDEEHIPTDISLRVTVIDDHHDKTYNLNFPGSHTVHQVKRDVSTVTDIPVFRQSWTGWPEHTNDELSLIQIGLPTDSTLRVTLVRKHDGDDAGPSRAGAGPSMPIVLDDTVVLSDTAQSDVEVSDDEYQDAPEPMEDDDFFLTQTDVVSRSGIQPLLPDDFGDEALAGIKFGEEFGNRYGQPTPAFFPGSLEDALAEACNKPVSERKMLAVYLHHDSSVLTNVFCTQVFCAEAVLGLMLENFVTWGWDLTYTSNKQRLLDMIARHFGSVASSTIKNFSIEKLPLVIVVAKIRGNLEIFQVIHGNVTLDEFMSSLLSAGESYQSQLSVEKAEEMERDSRNQVKDEQEKAFLEAQIRDQEKQSQMKEQEEEMRLQEQVMEAKRISELEAKEAAEAKAAVEQSEAASTLPAEPAADCGEVLANIRFRTPQSTLARRFLGSSQLSVLLLYLRSQGFRPEEYKVLSSFPRRDLTKLDHTATLVSLKLCPQETLTLEALHQGESDSE
jgi:FAS-associated factor 2